LTLGGAGNYILYCSDTPTWPADPGPVPDSDTNPEEKSMEILSRAYFRVTERKAQAMTEYALVLAAVAVVAFLVYQSMGNAISTLLNNVISDL
jgi:Flp pilus assembly pilin Flp